jgi:hypothetical protein
VTDDWTLEAYRAYEAALREGDARLREADQRAADLQAALEEQRVAHLREIMDRVQDYNRLHFDILNGHAAQTITDRARFVSRDEFGPFSTRVLEYIATAQGTTRGSDKTVAYIVATIGVLTGVIGTFGAVLATLGGG